MGSLKGKFDYEKTVAPEINSNITTGEAVKIGLFTGLVAAASTTAATIVGGGAKKLLGKFF